MKKSGMGRFCQSKEWQRYEEMEGRETFSREGEGWHYLAVLYKRPIGNYLYCPYGPIAGARELPAALDSLVTLAKEQGCFFVRIEPMLALVDNGASGDVGSGDAGVVDKDGDDSRGDDVISVDEMKKLGCVKSHDLDPAHTWVLNLEGQTREELLAGMSGTRTRYYRKAERSGVTVRRTKDPEEIGILTKLLGNLGEKNGFRPQSYEHLKNQMKAGFATLYVAEVTEDGKQVPIAALLVHEHDGVRSYAHAAADDKYRKLSGGAVVTVQAILDAKDEGMKEFDFWGISLSEDPKHPWYHFSQFKRSFGGRQVDYAGTWDKPVVKWKYWVYRVLRKVKNHR